MKRFLLGALGTLSLAGISLADSAPGTAKAASPVIAPYQPMVDGSHGQNNCAPCVPADCCDTGCGRGGLVGGISALYLRPHFTSNPSLSLNSFDSTTIVDPVTDGSTNTTLVTNGNPDFGHDWSFSPRIWIGFQGQHLGAAPAGSNSTRDPTTSPSAPPTVARSVAGATTPPAALRLVRRRCWAWGRSTPSVLRRPRSAASPRCCRRAT